MVPNYKFKATKSVPSLRTLQNGGNRYVERSFETRRLSCKDRPQGCMPIWKDHQKYGNTTTNLLAFPLG